VTSVRTSEFVPQSAYMVATTRYLMCVHQFNVFELRQVGPNYSDTLPQLLCIDNPTVKNRNSIARPSPRCIRLSFVSYGRGRVEGVREGPGEPVAQPGKHITVRTRFSLLNSCCCACCVSDADWMCRREGFLRVLNPTSRASGPTDKTTGGCSGGRERRNGQRTVGKGH